MPEDLIKQIVKFLTSYGIDPIYASTILIIVIHLIFDFRKYKNWNSITAGQKFYTIIGLVAVLVLISLSMLNLLGFFDSRK